MAKVYVLMGKSSTGKDTVYKRLMEESDSLKSVVIYTTRPMREGEEDGREYYFISDEKLNELQSEGKIIEYREYNTVFGIWKYFTVDDGQIDRNSDNKFLVIGTLEAYTKFVSYYGKDQVVPIYIEVDDRTRIHRAIMREDNEKTPKYAEMCRRFLADEEDFSEDKISAAGIGRRFHNFDLEKCVSEILDIIEK